MHLSVHVGLCTHARACMHACVYAYLCVFLHVCWCCEQSFTDAQLDTESGRTAHNINCAYRNFVHFLSTRLYVRLSLLSNYMVRAAYKGLVCTMTVLYNPFIIGEYDPGNSIPRCSPRMHHSPPRPRTCAHTQRTNARARTHKCTCTQTHRHTDACAHVRTRCTQRHSKHPQPFLCT